MTPLLWSGQLAELTLLTLASSAPAVLADAKPDSGALPSRVVASAEVELEAQEPAIDELGPAPDASVEELSMVAEAESVLDSLERVAETLRGEATDLDASTLTEGSDSDQVVRQLLASHMDRDAEKTLEDLRWLPGDLDPLRASLVRALGESHDIRSLDWISEQLDDPELVADALIEIARLARSAPEAVLAELRPEVRSVLDDSDGQLRRLARTAAVALHDEEATPLLVDLLEGSDEAELEQLQRTLEALTGVPRPPEPGGWARWLDSELAWSGAHSARVLGELESRDAATTAAAIHEFSARTYQRARWSEAIGQVALDDRRSPELRRMAILALQQLHSPASTPILTELIAAPGAGEAHEALVALAETVLVACGR